MAKKATGCNCLEQVNEELLQHNTRLKRELMLNFKTGEATMTKQVFLATEKVDSKKKREPAKSVLASYCPFCGKKY